MIEYTSEELEKSAFGRIILRADQRAKDGEKFVVADYEWESMRWMIIRLMTLVSNNE